MRCAYQGGRAGLLCALLLGSCMSPTPTAPAGTSGAPSPAAVEAGPARPPAAVPSAAALGHPVVVRVGNNAGLADAPIFIAMARGYFAERGLAVEPVEFAAGGEMIPAVATGQLEVASGGVSASLFNSFQRGLDLKIVADRSRIMRGAPYFAIATRPERLPDFSDYSALRGKRIALPGRGSIGEYMLNKAAERGGVNIAEIDVQGMSGADTLTSTANGSVDAAMTADPFLTQGVRRGLLLLWRTADEFADGTQAGVLVYGGQFIREQQEAGRQFMVAYLKGVRDYYRAFLQGIDRQGIAELLAQNTALKDVEIYSNLVAPYGIDPDGAVDTDSLRAQYSYWIERGAAQAGFDIANAMDLQFLRYAIEQLGRFQH